MHILWKSVSNLNIRFLCKDRVFLRKLLYSSNFREMPYPAIAMTPALPPKGRPPWAASNELKTPLLGLWASACCRVQLSNIHNFSWLRWEI